MIVARPRKLILRISRSRSWSPVSSTRFVRSFWSAQATCLVRGRFSSRSGLGTPLRATLAIMAPIRSGISSSSICSVIRQKSEWPYKRFISNLMSVSRGISPRSMAAWNASAVKATGTVEQVLIERAAPRGQDIPAHPSPEGGQGLLREYAADNPSKKAPAGLRQQRPVNDILLKHLSPLGWEHFNLTGDYVWHADKRVAAGRFRPLRVPSIQKAQPQRELI